VLSMGRAGTPALISGEKRAGVSFLGKQPIKATLELRAQKKGPLERIVIVVSRVLLYTVDYM
jgi:hypothetical protein